jgi:F-type H+-transporting ATPase subunit a
MFATFSPLYFAAAEEGHHLPLNAPVVFEFAGLHFTNSMLVSFVVAAVLIVVAQLATRNIQLVPSGLQNFAEFVVEGLHGLLATILGDKLVKKTFWFFATIFVFIVASNWFALIPGVGTIGYGEMTEHGQFEVTRPWVRGVNADLNMTLAMAIIFMVLWLFWSIQELGVGGFFHHIFGSKAAVKGLGGLALGAVFFFVGLIEVVSISSRLISLPFRLFGNIYGGESTLEAVGGMVSSPFLAWLPLVPFYVLESLVGLVQGLVFCLLTAVFTALMCRHDDHGSHGEDAAHH